MSASVNPDIVTDGLVLCLDAGNSDCFRGEPTVNKINGLYSTSFANSGFTITNNYTTNFDGSETASLLTSGSWIARTGGYSSGFTNGNTYTTTWILKRVDRDTVSLGWGGVHTGTRVNVSVNLANGTVSSASDPSLYGIYSLGNGWYAVWHVTTLSGTAHYPQLSSTLAGAKYLYGGMQVEEKSYPTSIVNGTRGSTVATGGGLADLSGNNNHGTIVRSASPTAAFYNESNKGSLVFDGSNDYIVFPNNLSIDSNLFSCECFFSYNTIGNKNTLFSINYNYPSSGYLIRQDNNNKIIVFSDHGIETNVVSVSTISANIIKHLVVTQDNNVCTIYIDGIQNFQSSLTNPAFNTANESNIGRRGTPVGAYLDGKIYCSRIYNISLSPVQVLQNYKALKGRYGL
jgi:hypothetical protein